MDNGTWEFKLNQYKYIYDYPVTPKYNENDHLYVKETFAYGAIVYGENPDGTSVPYLSQCQDENDVIPKEMALRQNIGIEDVKWISAMHMTKDMTRIFLRVTNVRLEQLQDISHEDALREGMDECPGYSPDEECCCAEINFFHHWDSTIKKKDLATYGLCANPWVWVYEFEVVEEAFD